MKQVENPAGSPTKGQYALLGLLLVYPMFGQLLPGTAAIGLVVASAGLTVLWFFTATDWPRLYLGFAALAWLILALYAIFSHVLRSDTSRTDSYFLLLAVVLALMASNAVSWISAAVRVLVLYSSIHAIATVIFYFSPNLYATQFKPRFYPNSPAAVDFTSGLTAHYSYNALFIAVGFVSAALVALLGQFGGWRRVRYSFIAGLGLFALLLTTKRAHLVFAIATVLLVYLFVGGRWRIFTTAAMVVTGFVALSWLAQFNEGIANSFGRVFDTFDTLDDLATATNGRTFLWDHAIAGWRESPFFGQGWSSFYYQWPGSARNAVLAHNEILNLAYEGGVVAVALFIIAALASFATTIGWFKRGNSTLTAVQRTPAAVSLGLQFFLVSYAVTTGGLLTDPHVFSFYFVALAIALALFNSGRAYVTTEDEEISPPDSSTRRPFVNASTLPNSNRAMLQSRK